MNLRTIVALCLFAVVFAVAPLRAEEVPLPPDSSVDSVLDALNERGKPPAEFTAKLSDTTGDSALGNEATHTGQIWFSRQDANKLRVRVLFDKLVVGHVIQNQKREYLLDGEWLTDRNYDSKTETKRQVLKPGEKKDLMKLGAGPFPLPIGQDASDVKKSFDVTKIASAKGDPAGTIHLTLTPKDGTELAKKFKVVDIWVDQKSHMPVVIDTLSGSEEHRIELKEIKVNPNPPLKDKDFELLEVDSSWNLKTESYGG